MLGFLLPLAVYALVLVLHLALPARTVDGYVRDPATSRPLRYRLNGLPVFIAVIALYCFAAHRGFVAWDLFWIHRWQAAAGACVLGLVFTLAVVLPAAPRGSLGADLYLGRVDNPQWLGGRVDAKMFLYLAGAVMLELNVLSFAAHHVLAHPADPSRGLLLYAAMFTFFLVEYLTFEEVHLYTYDFFAERVGFKLGWGCLVFYPFFYCVGSWATAARANPHTSPVVLAIALICFFGGWMLSRGANLQKFYFKISRTRRDKELLSTGFWGLSRHINYLGEILMAVGLTLALGWPLAILPWLYPLYYVALLLPRQRSDDLRCAAKYGALWQEYCRRVPYRIIPWIY